MKNYKGLNSIEKTAAHPTVDSASRTHNSQWPSFTRWNDQISRLPFIGHWLLSLALVIAVPLVMTLVVEALRLYGLTIPLMLLACLPGVQLYWVSARRRLIDLDTNAHWVLLITPLVLVPLFAGYDSGMRAALSDPELGPTVNPTFGALLMLPAIVLHTVLMVRRGSRKPKA